MAASTTALSIGGTSLNPFQMAWTGGPPVVLTAGNYFALPPYGDPPTEGPAIYEERHISLPGVDGVATKRFGFRGRSIKCTIIVVHSSKSNVESAKNTLFSTWTALAAFSITLPGGTARPKCKLVQPAANSGSWFGIDQKYCLALPCEFIQLREA